MPDLGLAYLSQRTYVVRQRQRTSICLEFELISY